MVTAAAKPEASEQRPERAAGAPFVLAAPLKLKLPDCWASTDEALIELSRLNEAWRFELSAERELVIMSPEGRGSSKRGLRIGAQVIQWSDTTGGGEVYGPDLGVRLPDMGMRMADVAWASDQRVDQPGEDDEGLLGQCPELIVEVVSRSDDAAKQRGKMQLWIRNGALLGWLVDPFEEVVWIYRADAEPERLERPDSLNGEDVCVGLEVSLERVWK